MRLFVSGGLAILKKIRAIDYDVWRKRPEVTKWDKLRIVFRSWWQTRFRGKDRPA